MVTKPASEIFRDYVVDGNPASGAHSPIKADIRQWGGEIEDLTVPLPLPVLFATDFGISASNSAGVNDAGWAALKTALGSGGYRVILWRGKAQFSSALDCSSLTNVIFEGHGGLDLTYSGNFGTVIEFTGTGAGNIITMTNHRGVWWRDVQVVYSSNSFTGTLINCSTTFTTGCGSGFERVQCYQITNSGHSAGQCFYVKNNVDVTFENCYVSHADFGWLGLFNGDPTSPTNETNMIKLVNCTSIALQIAAIVNPIIGWSCYGCNFELSDVASGEVPAGILATGAHTVTNLSLFGCVFADSTGSGTWINLPVNVFGFMMIGGGVLTAAVSPTGTGILIGSTVAAGIVINGVLFSGLSIGINIAASGTIASIVGNNFLNTTTALSGSANLDATSIVFANNGLLPRPIGVSAGGTGVTQAGGPIYLGASATGVNFNSVADTSMNIVLPAGVTRYRIQAIIIYNPSGTLTTAQVALFTGSGGTGTAILSATACTVSTAAADTNNNAQYIGPSITAAISDTSLFFRITTPQGVAANASVAIQVQPLP